MNRMSGETTAAMLDDEAICRFAAAPEVYEPAAADEELLARFLAERDDQAFTQLVARHGPMVLAVCRRTLGNQQDAEDAFQAAFLVLARKAHSLRKARSLPAWLYQAAYRIALRARAGRARRRELPLEVEAMIAPDTLSQISQDYEQTLVDDELNGLPEKYRLPVFLCCVEGKSLDEAARQLGWSLGSLKGRLERGRQELRRRLMLRRATPAAVAVALAACLPRGAEAAVLLPPALAASTVQAGMQYAAGHSTLGYVSPHALSLADGSFQIMSAATAKFAACVTLSIGLLVYGGSKLPAFAYAGNGTGPANVIELDTGAVLPIASDSAFPDTLVALAGDDAPSRITKAELVRRTYLDVIGAQPTPEEVKAFVNDASPDAYKKLVDQLAARAAPREGDAPRIGARDGDAPRTGPRDGDSPRTGLRDGDAPRTGAREGAPSSTGDRERERARTTTSREGARGEQREPLAGFQPANPREAALLQMIMQLRSEVAELRDQLNARGERAADGVRKPGAREGSAKKGEGDK